MHGGSFLMHRVYADELTLKLVQSASEVLGLSADACLEALGCHFLYFCQQHGYDHILRVLGSNLTDFLTNLDNLHDHLASTYPGMSAPSFRVSPGPLGSLHLHYCSERRGLHPIVKGLVKTVAREFFDTEVSVSTCKVTDKGDRVVVLMEVSENLLKLPMPLAVPTLAHKRSSFTSAHVTDHLSQSPQDLPVDTRTFCTAFPFHVVFDRDFVITQAGKGLLRLTKSMWQRGKPVRFTDMFSISRPVIECTFESILGFLNQVYVVTARDGVLERDRKSPTGPRVPSPVANKRKLLRRLNSTVEPPPDGVLRLKGQMMSLPESDSLLFLCSPRVKSLEDMKRVGLFFSDLALHDPVRDLILVSHQRRRERELVEKLDEASNHLKILDSKLREDKRRTEDLLCSIFPAGVARSLCQNLPVEAEKFELVSCLFSDIVGFTALCGSENVQPMDIVRLLNRLYVQFDSLTGVHGVYKVETIGDAYVVVSGVPEFLEDHADRLVAMGLAMQAVTRTVRSPVEGHSIEIRIGIHSGPAMAGVVGTQMPRYCLFGHTVTLANRVESYGMPKQVNISETTKGHLTKDGYMFLANKAVSADLPVRCYCVSRPGDSVAVDPATLGASLGLCSSGGHFRSPTGSPVLSEKGTPAGSRSSSTHSSPPVGSPSGGATDRGQGVFSSPPNSKRQHRRNVFQFPPAERSSSAVNSSSWTLRRSRSSSSDFQDIPSADTSLEDAAQDASDLTMCVINVESASSLEPSLSSDTLSSRGTSPGTERKPLDNITKSATAESPLHSQDDGSGLRGGFMILDEQTQSSDEGLPRLKSPTTEVSYSKLRTTSKKASLTCCPFGSKRQDMNRNVQLSGSLQNLKPRCPFRLGGEDEDDLEVYQAEKASHLDMPDKLYDLSHTPSSESPSPASTCAVPTVVVRPPPEPRSSFPCWRFFLKKADKKSAKSGLLQPISADGSGQSGRRSSSAAGCPMRRMFSQVLAVNVDEAETASLDAPSPGKRTQSCYSFRNLEISESRSDSARKESPSHRFALPHFNWHFPKLKQRFTKENLFGGDFFSSSPR
ncbi:guanylate cyclase soluble subunit beta-2 [Ixodes scapularis]|uniref:guanylate cyclase soluble subunit beta-2 n=1 Tax=Ixodes scapularis TaxID=6945 RepID=UPI001C391269|nr:guanylate cyclase soluble subunit beta-2 [Ixodes scapularis]